MGLTNIKELRKTIGITQAELAQLIGVNRATISKYESGTIEMPVSQAKKLAPVFKVRWYEMYID